MKINSHFAAWTVEPEQIWKKPRTPGISGFMRLKNEAAFLDRAIETHVDGLDELIIVHNDCSDETPEICARWAHRYPEKIKIFEYEPKVVPIGGAQSRAIDPRSPHCIANYYNFALALTNRKIAIKIDGDHLAVIPRFNRICEIVRRNLPPKQRYPIYGLNITVDRGEIVIYNYYDFASAERGERLGPPPFTSGDHAFYHVDETCWHTVHPIEGYEAMDLADKLRFHRAPMTYAFFHLKGMKDDRGTANWRVTGDGSNRFAAWADNVLAPNDNHFATVEAMRRHNPAYFRGVSVARELLEAFPDIPMRRPRHEILPPLGLREHLAEIWYRMTYP
jgi:hypothetical protein